MCVPISLTDPKRSFLVFPPIKQLSRLGPRYCKNQPTAYVGCLEPP